MKQSFWILGLLGGAIGVRAEVVPGEYIVKLRAGVRPMVQVLGTMESLDARGDFKLVRRGGDAAHAMAALRASGAVEYVEPNYVRRIVTGAKPPEGTTDTAPNDQYFKKLWGFSNQGQTDSDGQSGVAGADIKAIPAWGITRGSKSVVVAVVDTGIDYRHPDLKANMWSLPDAANVHGFNAVTNSNDPMDDNSHGSHCAGTIGAVQNNRLGVAGVAPNVSLMAVKFLDGEGSGSDADAIRGIDWAREHGAKVMSNSWGGGGESTALREAIERAGAAGIVFVAAAGNDGVLNDGGDHWPSNYSQTMDNVISVAASTNRDELADFSNYGFRTVDLMAPGQAIWSTVPNGGYKWYSGTSMATPHVAGAVALLLAKEPNLTPREIKARLRSSVDPIASVRNMLVSGGRLNVLKLLRN